MALQKEEVMVSLGLDSSKIEAQGAVAGNVIERTLAKSTKALNRLIGLNLVGIVKDGVTKAVDVASSALADLFFSNREILGQGDMIEHKRQQLKAMRKEQLAEQAAHAKEMAALEKERLDNEEKLFKLQEQSDFDAKDSYSQIDELQKRISERKKKLADADEDENARAYDKLRLLQDELALRKLLDQQKQNSDKSDKQNKDFFKTSDAALQAQAQGISDSHKYDPQLKRIKDLKSDAAASDRFNPARAKTDRLIAGQLENQLRSQMAKDLQDANKPQTDMLSEIKDILKDLNVTVKNVDNK